MGEFSWTRADKATRRSNIALGDRYKLLIPREFGGGFIEDEYRGYGELSDGAGHDADLYGILAFWNKCENVVWDERCDHYPRTIYEILEYGCTDHAQNRDEGIAIGCHKSEIDKLKYPLKLVSVEYKGTYESCRGKSYDDFWQGCMETYYDEDNQILNRLPDCLRDFIWAIMHPFANRR